MKKCMICKKEKPLNMLGVCEVCHNKAVKEAEERVKGLDVDDMIEAFLKDLVEDSTLSDEDKEELKGMITEAKEEVKTKRKEPVEEPKLKPKEEIFLDITSGMFEVYKRKNHDYGDSFGKQFDKFGLDSSVIRLHDKLSRLENLCSVENKVKDESIIDTLLDMANYCIMTVIELER